MRRYPFLIALFWMIFSLGHSQMVVIPTLILQVVCDLTITASMVYYLYTRCTRVKQCVNLWGGIRSYRWRVQFAGQSLRPLHSRSTPLQVGRLHCSFPECLLRHVSLTPPQCILDFMPYKCPFLSPYYSSICFSLTASACQFVRFPGTLIFAPFFFVLMRIYVCAFMALSVHAFLLLCFSHGNHRFSADLTPGTASALSSLRRPKMESRSPSQSSQMPGTLVGLVLET